MTTTLEANLKVRSYFLMQLQVNLYIYIYLWLNQVQSWNITIYIWISALRSLESNSFLLKSIPDISWLMTFPGFKSSGRLNSYFKKTFIIVYLISSRKADTNIYNGQQFFCWQINSEQNNFFVKSTNNINFLGKGVNLLLMLSISWQKMLSLE